uniref:Ovule protein n=1 Tax=Brugia malayi TaxID=6279 RepID=A0A912GZZ3_BRUMA
MYHYHPRAYHTNYDHQLLFLWKMMTIKFSKLSGNSFLHSSPSYGHQWKEIQDKKSDTMRTDSERSDKFVTDVLHYSVS